MAVEFPCSQCQAELRVELKDVGKKARCPRCGMIHEVPILDGSGSVGSQAESNRAADQIPNMPNAEHHSADENSNPTVENATTVYRAATPSGEPIHTIDSSPLQWSMKTPDGSVYGPVDRVELDDWAQEGRISSQCLLRPNGSTHWQSAISVYPNLAGLRAAPMESVPVSSIGRQATSSSPRVNLPNGIFQRTNNGLAICLFAIFSFFFSVFPPFNIIAFIWARREKSEIESGEVDPRNRYLLDISQAISIFGMIISAMMVFGCMLG